MLQIRLSANLNKTFTLNKDPFLFLSKMNFEGISALLQAKALLFFLQEYFFRPIVLCPIESPEIRYDKRVLPET